MEKIKLTNEDLPGLYQSADVSSLKEQKKYFNGIRFYLIFLIIASMIAFSSQYFISSFLRISSAIIFLGTMAIMIWLRLKRPNDIWYNGRAVAESVKTRAWRWMMKAEPYLFEDLEAAKKKFINDLKTILNQNERLIGELGISASFKDPISAKMVKIRNMSLKERFNIYRTDRVTDQEKWYCNKAEHNKKKARYWFIVTLVLHIIAFVALLYNIKEPNLQLPIEVIAVGASSVLTWLQAKKYNELRSSYSLAAHEIVLIKSEVTEINTEEEFSDYVINCEGAFSREHTQWFARKNQ